MSQIPHGTISSGSVSSGLLQSFSVQSGGVSSGNVMFGNYPVMHTCECCDKKYNRDTPGAASWLGEHGMMQGGYCPECSGYSKERKGIITRKDLIIASTGLQTETPTEIIVDWLLDHDRHDDAEYFRRFLK